MNTSITYQQHPNGNVKEIEKFIGSFPECEVCHGHGEYEGEFGPIGCNPCNSRLLPFLDKDGITLYADWGDSIMKDSDGHLSLVCGGDNE